MFWRKRLKSDVLYCVSYNGVCCVTTYNTSKIRSFEESKLCSLSIKLPSADLFPIFLSLSKLSFKCIVFKYTVFEVFLLRCVLEQPLSQFEGVCRLCNSIKAVASIFIILCPPHSIKLGCVSDHMFSFVGHLNASNEMFRFTWEWIFFHENLKIR